MRAVAGGATPAKQSWLPGTPIPAYLEDLPAAYGFDPLRLGTNSGALRVVRPTALAGQQRRCTQARHGAATLLACSARQLLYAEPLQPLL